MPYGCISTAILLLPFAAALATPLIGRGNRRRTTWLMTSTAGVCLVLSTLLFPGIADGEVLHQTFAWAPALGLEFTLRVDGLTWLFLVLICGIGLLVGIYATYYMPREYPLVRFYSLLLAFMGAMLGIVLSGNVIQLVFFWELTSLFSFLLIGYWHHGKSARDAARTALVVTVMGGLCLLAGVLLLAHIAGSYDVDAILVAGDRIRESPLYLPALALVLVGAFTKSAQVPFHFWLPQAMSAPTPVSAYLHSATMVKAGVFLLLRFWPVLAGTEEWFWIVGGVGLTTMLVGAWAATFQHDMKAVLAYSTISHLGLITMLAGLGSTLGVVAAIFHTVNHATFKASMFMAVGAVDHETGTRDLRRLGGLRHVMPITATLAVIAGAAMAGVPLLNGFLSKEMFFAVALGANHGLELDTLTVLVALIAAALGVTYSLRLVGGAFFGPLRHDFPRQPHEPPRWMRFPIGTLALACLAVGVFPAWVVGPPLRAAATSVLGVQLPVYDLAIWHGLTLPLLMSVIAFVIGCVVYWVLRRRIAARDATPLIGRIPALHWFERALAFATTTLPELQRRVFPSRHLQVQLLLVVLLAGILGLVAVRPLPVPAAAHGMQVDPAFALLWLLGVACAIGAATHAKFQRMAALIFTAGTGLVVCITFVWLSAPDLAVTQLVVESVTTVLLLLGLRWLPKRVPGLSPLSRVARYRRIRDAVVAIAVGAGLASLAYTVMNHLVADSASRFFLEQALPGGGGRNVVNVILVDFRALDTLGEITVLAIVALAVFALLWRFRPAAESIGAPHQREVAPAQDEVHADRHPPAWTDQSATPGLLILLIAPLIALFALHLFLRGHNLPGGGFVAGITVTMTLIVLYMAGGTRWLEARLRIAPARWIGMGLLLAIATGLAAVVLGDRFLTSYHGRWTVPVLGEIPFNSALLFDLGVFAVVTGASALMLVVLAHQSLRRVVQPPGPPRETGEAEP
ncbi:MAG TPA: monovalent cation/H+ antiporter subunit A [Rhodanobacteraceae bacterium]|nr:monovalent cation/H+ antiporter subunit A [Rhodanobacteraceae bacterium]